MKKILALVLAAMMVLCLAACGAGEETAEETAPAEVIETTEAVEATEPAAEEAVTDASGEMAASGEASGSMGNQSTDFEIEVNGVSGTAHYEDVDNGDQSTKSFIITFDGSDIEGAIEMGVWTAVSGDAGDQAVVDAVQAAFEGSNSASGEVAA